VARPCLQWSKEIPGFGVRRQRRTPAFGKLSSLVGANFLVLILKRLIQEKEASVPQEGRRF
jgi:hypothetical protein